MKKLISFLLFISISYTYSQNGANWTEQNSGVNSNLTSVSYTKYDYNKVWVCGYNGTVLYTNDRGNHWQNVSSNLPPNIQLTTICSNNDYVLTAGNIGNIAYTYRTSDYGQSWQQVFSQNSGFINSIAYTQGSTILDCIMIGNPVGGRWSIWKSNDRGITWDSTSLYLQQSGSESGYGNSFCMTSTFGNYEMWFGTNNNGAYYSFNSGQSWLPVTITEQNSYCIYIDGYNSIRQSFLEGFIGGDNLIRTSDAGVGWYNVPSVGNGPIKAITSSAVIIIIPGDNYSFQNLWYIRNNKIYYSSNNGNSWSNEYTSPNGNYNHMSDATEKSFIWAVRDNGGISKGEVEITSVSPPETYPYSFKLLQNYPNPFNPTTTIAFTIYKATRIKLNVYNIRGELVTTLLDQDFTPGLIMYDYYSYMPYTVTWDGKNYGSGVYFYKITADDYTATRKMMLIK